MLTVIDLVGLAALSDTAPGQAGAPPDGSGQLPAEAAIQKALKAPEAQEAQWQRSWHEPLNCAVVFTDIAGFSDPLRTDSDREVVRAALYEILRGSFEASGCRGRPVTARTAVTAP